VGVLATKAAAAEAEAAAAPVTVWRVPKVSVKELKGLAQCWKILHLGKGAMAMIKQQASGVKKETKKKSMVQTLMTHFMAAVTTPTPKTMTMTTTRTKRRSKIRGRRRIRRRRRVAPRIGLITASPATTASETTA
jgi:hypothetical protein